MSYPQKKERIFRFKQFSVRHERSGMKVGTDGVLLGAWVDVTHAQQFLDIGTGSGVIALMLAQRTDPAAMIDAVELDTLAYEEACENFNASPWKEKINPYLSSIQNFATIKKYDLIISNPPYFQNSFKPPAAQREVARHTGSLTFADLITAAEKLLRPTGRLNVILPNAEGLQFETLALEHGFYCTRKWTFKTRKEKPIERWLLEFSWQSKPTDSGEILLYSAGENWSEGYKALTGEFYLKA
jgi:tRNA1Val (adenine37-N6)-methyltransferase